MAVQASRMTYVLYSHDAWGRARVGSFESLDQAREVFDQLCNDRWCIEDGGMRAVSLVDEGVDGSPTLAMHTFRSLG